VSTSHQTRSSSRQATRAREHRDGSPGDSSSSRSRSGSGDRHRRHGTSGNGRGREPTERTERSQDNGTGRRSDRGNGNGHRPPDRSVKREPSNGPGPGGDGPDPPDGSDPPVGPNPPGDPDPSDDPDPRVTPAVAAARAASAKFVGNNLKYDGTTCLETFLARFNRYAKYLTWDERDKFYYLSIGLHGDAGQLLWDTDDESTYAGMVKLLRTRFGSVGQKERFRVELRNRCRKPGETIQHLYNDVRRLFSLSYPGQTSDYSSIVARDCFLDALGDDDFRIRILKKDPLNLDAALQLAVTFEAYDEGRSRQPKVGADRVAKTKESYSQQITGQNLQQVSSESVQSGVNEEAVLKLFEDTMQHCISQMSAFGSAVDNQRKRLNGGGQNRQKQGGYKKNGFGSSPQAQEVATSPVGNAMAVGGAAQPQQPLQQKSPGNKQSSAQTSPGQRGKGRGPCFNCDEVGHFKNNCPYPPKEQDNGIGQAACQPPEPRVQLIDSTDSQKSTYLSIQWQGRQYNALLDSGCEVSVIGKRLLPKDVVLQPAGTDLLAANRTKIPILGRLDMTFLLGGKTYFVKLAVTSAIDELLLGVDFLSRYSAKWNFGAGELYLEGQTFPLQQKVIANQIRRIYADESVRIPAMARKNISVVVTKPSLQASDEWRLNRVTVCKGLRIEPVNVKSFGSLIAIAYSIWSRLINSFFGCCRNIFRANWLSFLKIGLTSMIISSKTFRSYFSQKRYTSLRLCP